MDPQEHFRDSKLLHFQFIFNIIQHFSTRLKLFDIRSTIDFNSIHLPKSISISPDLLQDDFSFGDLCRLTDSSKLRRCCIIIAYSSNFLPYAEQLRKILMRQKCKEIHMLDNIEDFNARYSFLLEYPKIKDFPNEIIPMFLYIGSEQHAQSQYVVRDLKITHILNATKTAKNKFATIKYCKVIVLDKEDEEISRFFQKTYEFIEEAMHENQMGASNVVLVHCAQGVSRSVTIVIMFLMRTFGMSLEESMNFIKMHRHKADPNPGFIKQLERFYSNRYKFSKSMVSASLNYLE